MPRGAQPARRGVDRGRVEAYSSALISSLVIGSRRTQLPQRGGGGAKNQNKQSKPISDAGALIGSRTQVPRRRGTSALSLSTHTSCSRLLDRVQEDAAAASRVKERGEER
jgi:hypothetical protein